MKEIKRKAIARQKGNVRSHQILRLPFFSSPTKTNEQKKAQGGIRRTFTFPPYFFVSSLYHYVCMLSHYAFIFVFLSVIFMWKSEGQGGGFIMLDRFCLCGSFFFFLISFFTQQNFE